MHHKAIARKALLNSAVKLAVIIADILFDAGTQLAQVQSCVAGLKGIIGPAYGLDALPECELAVRQLQLEAKPLAAVLREYAQIGRASCRERGEVTADAGAV